MKLKWNSFIENCLWAEAKIDFPPLPQKKMHNCHPIGYDLVRCEEDVEGLFLVRDGLFMLGIKFCPWCGFQVNK